MNCPNDRYVNDADICQAVAANLARIGVKVNLQTETKVTYFPKILRRDTSLYLLGWTPSTYDAHNALAALIATRPTKARASSTWAPTATRRWTNSRSRSRAKPIRPNAMP